MQIFEVGPWILNVDVDATRAAYVRLTGAHTAGCNLVSCANFEANRENTFPEAAQSELENFGVDWRKEVYVYHTGGVAKGLYHYEGFFLLVGEILAGSPAQDVRVNEAHHWIAGQ